MTWLAASFAALFMAAIALLIVLLGCLDEQTTELRRLKHAAARRILELEREKNR